ALGILDQSPISAHFEWLLPALPAALQTKVATFLQGRPVLTPEAFLSIFRTLHRQINAHNGRIKIALGPVSAHWCSRALLESIQREAEALRLPIQIHLLETCSQRERALQQHGQSA